MRSVRVVAVDGHQVFEQRRAVRRQRIENESTVAPSEPIVARWTAWSAIVLATWASRQYATEPAHHFLQ